MKNIVFLILAIICTIIGFAGPKGIIEGAFKGLAGVFFVIYYIRMLLNNEPYDKTTSH